MVERPSVEKTIFGQLRREPDGLVYGAWDSEDNEEMNYDTPGEIHIESRLGKIDGKCDLGGPNSKYEENEDAAFVVATRDSLSFGVIDGAGGSNEGRLAARTLSVALIQNFKENTEVRRAVDYAEYALRRNVKHGGFATGVVVRITSGAVSSVVSMCYAGDSKVMTLRDHKKLEEGTTTFQNIAQVCISAGANKPHEYYTHPRLNVVTGGFGLPKTKRDIVGTRNFSGRGGDRIVAASDGFWDNVSEYEVEQLSAQCVDTGELQSRLFALAYERNNTLQPFHIQHDGATTVEKQLSYEETISGKPEIVSLGDNITVVVVELTNVGQ